MKRTFNYTNRQRIERKDVQFRLIESLPKGTLIGVNLDLSDYLFPATAKAFLETQGESTFARRELKNPFDPYYHEQVLLDEADVNDSTKFRFRVVESEASGRMLGISVPIPLANPADTISKQDALLPVKWGDTGQEIWRIDNIPIDGPTLYLSRALQDRYAQFAADPMFVACVVPQAFRRILEFALIDDDDTDVHEEDTWFNQWYRWMMAIPDMRRVASRLDDEIGNENLPDWIDEAVEVFAKMRSNRFVNTVSTMLNARA